MADKKRDRSKDRTPKPTGSGRAGNDRAGTQESGRSSLPPTGRSGGASDDPGEGTPGFTPEGRSAT